MRQITKNDGISRRDFIKNLPGHLLQNVQTLTNQWIAPFTDHEKKEEEGPRIAFVDIERCLAWGGTSCQFCYLVCPLRDQAIKIEEQKPVVVPSRCTGCAMCVVACRTVNDLPAIKIIDTDANKIRKESVHV